MLDREIESLFEDGVASRGLVTVRSTARGEKVAQANSPDFSRFARRSPSDIGGSSTGADSASVSLSLLFFGFGSFLGFAADASFGLLVSFSFCFGVFAGC